MRNSAVILAAVLVAIAASYTTVKMTAPQKLAEEKRETTFERVIRTNTLRCGYIPLKTLLDKDANTGKLGGISYDVIEQMAQNLGLKVEWVAESGFVSMSEDLDRGRFDMICNPLMPSAKRARALDFSRILFMRPATLWVHKDNLHTGEDLLWVNDPNVSFSFIDGIVFDPIIRRKFPKAKIISLPETTDHLHQLVDVMTGKTTATVNIDYDGREFIKANGDVIKPASSTPIAHIFYAFPLPKGDYEFKAMIDMALDEMVYNDTLESIIAAHDTVPSSYVRLKTIY